MTQSTTQTPEATKSSSSVAPQTTKKKRYTTEICMALLTAGFFGGVLLFTIVPEEAGPLRGMAMALYTCTIVYLLYRFGI